MKIDRVTITGADDNTDVSVMRIASMVYPFVEWGILFSKQRTGTPRYPSSTKLQEILEQGFQLSAHLCGQYSRDIMEGQDFCFLESLKGFKRAQINYNFGKSEGWEIKWVIEWARSHPEISLIFQSNYSNSRAIDIITKLPHPPSNIHFLYDSSGGRGVEIANIQFPYKNHYTGYSGGIHPGNISGVCGKIAMHKSKDKVWIDMESGVRTEDELDYNKIFETLAVCDSFIDEE